MTTRPNLKKNVTVPKTGLLVSDDDDDGSQRLERANAIVASHNR